MLAQLLSKKRVFISLVLVLVFVASSLLYLHSVKRQATLDLKRTQAIVNRPKPPPPGETAESGHWHGDEWHADVHETEQESVSVSGSGETWRDGVWYPEDYTQADLAADLAGEPAKTDEEYERRATKNLVNTYLREHREKYPDCAEHAAVLADAKRQTEWILADQKHVDKRRIHDAELDFIMSLYDDFREKYADTLFAGKKLSPADARVAESEKQAILEHLDVQDEKAKILKREKPIAPKPRHTH